MFNLSNKKIGIITCHRIPNHGSFLQAWSLWHYLSEHGANVEIIDYIYPNLYHLVNVHHNEIKRNTDTSNIVRKIKRYIIDRWYVCNRKRGLEIIIYRLINLFIHNPNKLFFKELKLSSKSYISPKELKSAKLGYDILISGSDQIWNPRFSGEDDVFFLQFGCEKMKRVAYSSSFGVADLEDYYKKQYSEWLNCFSFIATREESGTAIVRMLTGKHATHVLDPVMLFNRDEWSQILYETKYAERLPYPYIITYCLDYVYSGVIDYADSIMLQLAKIKGLKCATLYKSNLGDTQVFKFKETIHPFEFVNAIMNAEYALVSSFHGLAFCILFHTPFYVVIDRLDNRDSRLTDLLVTFGLSDRILTIGESFDMNRHKDIDWESVDRIYNQLLESSENYMIESLN